MTPMSTRESYIYDDDCKFCAHSAETMVAHVNTNICPTCYTWIADSVGLVNVGIRPTE